MKRGMRGNVDLGKNHRSEFVEYMREAFSNLSAKYSSMCSLLVVDRLFTKSEPLGLI